MEVPWILCRVQELHAISRFRACIATVRHFMVANKIRANKICANINWNFLTIAFKILI